MKFVFSLHDVCPFHLERVKKAEAYFEKWGISKVMYLYVPDFHHHGLAHKNEVFRSFCEEKKPFQVDWWLHGFYHIDDSTKEVDLSWKDSLKEKHLTGGEGEFLKLSFLETKDRLQEGLMSFQSVFKRKPLGFIAPAWLYNSNLPSALQELEISYTENHISIFNTSKDITWKAPAITWATRTWLRKKGSLYVCPFLYKLWRKEPVIRIAVHPHDFDHPETIANIEKVVKRALQEREEVFVTDLG